MILLTALVVGLLLGTAVGLGCGAGVVLALCVVLVPVLAAVVAGGAGQPTVVRSLGLVTLPLPVGAALATWRYRVSSRSSGADRDRAQTPGVRSCIPQGEP